MTTGELCIFPYVPTLSVVSQYLGLLEKSFQPAWNFFMPEFTLAHRLKAVSYTHLTLPTSDLV